MKFRHSAGPEFERYLKAWPAFAGGIERRTKNDNETARKEDGQGSREAGKSEAREGAGEIRRFERRRRQKVDREARNAGQTGCEAGQGRKSDSEG
jgi:hypothetical protein